MNYKTILFAGLTFFGLNACTNNIQDKTEENNTANKDSIHGEANHHMHKRSFEELVADFESPERAEWQKPEAVLSFMGDLTGKTVIDIGAGTGYMAFRFTDTSIHVIAADPDKQFLDYMTKKRNDKKLSNISIRKAEYGKPPVKPNEADLVYLIDVYHHIENRIEYFTHLKSGLKTNGKLIIIDFKKGDLPQGPPDEIKLDHQQVVEELKHAGFTLEKSDTTTLPYQYMISLK